MSKSQITMKATDGSVDIPLSRHGHGMQSLAVLYLFQAYIDILLKPNFRPETEAILALEEPEAHLHPQAARALAKNLSDMSPQKLITCHSPYFIQEIPFSQIRFFRREGPLVKVLSVKKEFLAIIPANVNLIAFCNKNKNKYGYNELTHTLHVKGKIEQQEYRELLLCYQGQPAIHKEIKRVMRASQEYISPTELEALEVYAKRIRGEVLFAHAWLLCEGPSDYEIIRCFAKILKKPLDQYGVTIIDFQNNGSASTFINLAQAFQIPWVMLCDNDLAGKSYIKQVRQCGLTSDVINRFVRLLPGDGTDLEKYLLTHGFLDDYIKILLESATPDNNNLADLIVTTQRQDKIERRLILKKDKSFEIQVYSSDVLIETIDDSDARYKLMHLEILWFILNKNKVDFARALVKKLQTEKADESRIPKEFNDLINLVCSRTNS